MAGIPCRCRASRRGVTLTQRALVISYHTVQPDRDSGARRIFHLIELLQSHGWRVAVLAADGVGDSHDVEALERLGCAVYDGLYESIEDVLISGPIDLSLIAFWPNAERYLPSIRRLAPFARVIVDSVDLHFIREARQALSRPDASGGRGISASIGSRFAAELNAYASADCVFTVSNKETSLLGDLLPDSDFVRTVPDFEDVPAVGLPFSRRRGIACIGSFQHAPNVDAVRYLCEEILPRVNPAVFEEHPVWIVGNGLDETIRSFGRGLPHVRMVGWVPSVLPYLEHARASVVPLLYGAGTKRKLIQALACGTPTVTTSIGVEGLEIRDGEHSLVADDPKLFAESLERLLSDAPLWDRLSRNGRAHIAATRGRRIAEQALLDAISTTQSREPKSVVMCAGPETIPRPTTDKYADLIARVHGSANSLLPGDAHVLVVTRGDSQLLDFDREAAHFPQDESGRWAGYHPASSEEAIDHLEALREAGADHLMFPSTATWWLDHYDAFAAHLDRQYTVRHRDEDCIIYELVGASTNGSQATGATVPAKVEVTHEGAGAEDVQSDVRIVAFYLPQFHPIPENDRWWGDGFTEWRNVARARPQFEGHYQPHVPADLGFYDLRLSETRQHQADLARRYGIHGFCYYHYWFESTKLLERPFAEVLESGEPDFPFCLCWANDPWSRRWDGRTEDLLQEQTYSDADDLAHIRHLLPALADARAIRVEGRPMFLVYRASHLPNPERTTETWRREVERAGLPGIHLVAVETAWDLGWDATRVGFDAKVLFQPQFGWLMTHAAKRGAQIEVPGIDALQVYEYDTVVKLIDDLEPVSYRRYETVFPGWDNTARSGERAVVMHGATPERYAEWLAAAVSRARLAAQDDRIVFVNAWNEWAEGCHLEPDLRHGTEYLEATGRVLRAEEARR